MNKKKIGLIVGLSIVATIIIAIVFNVNLTSNSVKEEANSLNESKNTEETTEKSWQNDLKSYGVLKYFDLSYDIEKEYQEMKKIEETNLFAKQYVSLFEKLNIDDESNKFNAFVLRLLVDYIKMSVADNDLREIKVNNVFYTIDDKTGTYLYLIEIDNGTSLDYVDYFHYVYTIGSTSKDTISYYDTKIANEYCQIDYDSNVLKLYKNSNGLSITSLKNKTLEVIPTEISEDENFINFISFIIEAREIAKPEVLQRIAQQKIEQEEKLERERYFSMPRVGMKDYEVRQTKWGNPDKINKDTYSWGTTEQWVYNKYGYVYIQNGVVTSVSER